MGDRRSVAELETSTWRHYYEKDYSVQQSLTKKSDFRLISEWEATSDDTNNFNGGIKVSDFIVLKLENFIEFDSFRRS